MFRFNDRGHNLWWSCRSQWKSWTALMNEWRISIMICLVGGEDYHSRIFWVVRLSEQRRCCNFHIIMKSMLVSVFGPGLFMADAHCIARLAKKEEFLTYHWRCTGFLDENMELRLTGTKWSMEMALMIAVSTGGSVLMRLAIVNDRF